MLLQVDNDNLTSTLKVAKDQKINFGRNRISVDYVFT